MTSRGRAHAVVALYAFLALFVWPVYPHFQSPNELTRWAADAAIVEHRSLEIPAPVLSLLLPAFEDLSVVDGRTFSNKAPGLALVALPAYLAARPFAGAPSPGSLRVTLVAMRLVGSTLPAILLALLFLRAAVRFGAEESRLPVAVFALLFATPFFAYGLLLFSHVLVAACLFGAFVALFLPASSATARGRELLAGALLGLAVLSEYPAAVPALVLIACAAARKSLPRLLRIVAGGLPFALLLFAYDAACFGGPFQLSSAHERYAGFQDLAGSGLFGVSLPSATIFARLLLDPSKGL
ncbi:MAG TPA: hypothetical protein VGR00_05580, partial [Thermoanaerobaculia bacterium]|nr:hypothetical protein [Thermoanaerobaculia bacterium]